MQVKFDSILLTINRKEAHLKRDNKLFESMVD